MIPPLPFAFISWIFDGPIGGLIIAALGFYLLTRPSPPPPRQPHRPTTAANDFTISFLVLIAAIMKADGHPTRAELAVVKDYLRTHYPPPYCSSLLQTLHDLLRREIPLAPICDIIRRHMNPSQRLHLLYTLYTIAYADSYLHPRENDLLSFIATSLGISPADAQSIAARFLPHPHPTSDYRILGIPPTATNDQLRHAYRRMAMKYHPDKLSHLGPSYQKTATAKFQQINAAYHRIKKNRGLP